MTEIKETEYRAEWNKFYSDFVKANDRSPTIEEVFDVMNKQIEELQMNYNTRGKEITSLREQVRKLIHSDRSYNKLDCDWKVNAIKRAGELARKNKIKPEGCIIGKDEFEKDFIAHCGCADCINRSEALLDLRKGYLEKVNKITELEAQIEKMKNCFNCKKRDMQPCRKSCNWEWDKGEF